ncbi:type I restriction endonuclease subunit R [Alistipes sp. An66]|uniref:type I restriction endonuclease subunit R n=1 Tax=Alistipes sp. An66 TaxID=1965650 RepID=UPI000B3873AB|nr:type I restriction endonuclease subunit R [Alistipes sp. An66]OUN58453.1 type I restriction endonuclease [Alistipes sp. An66]
MPHFNEYALEMSIMELFRQEGYIYTNGEEIHKEVSDVLLRDDLRAYLRGRYGEAGITSLEIERAVAKLTANVGFSLYENNLHTYRLMVEGFSLKRDDSSLPDLYVEPIDFGERCLSNNIFRVVNQLEIKGTETRIPDGIVYVNGLPVVVLEFKSAVKEETTIMDAYRQLTVRYRRDIPELFKYNAFVVISDGVNNKYGSLFAPYDFFYAWRKVHAEERALDGINSLKTMMQGLFRRERLLSVLKDFVFFPDSSKDERKVVCRYPQFFAAHKLFENIRLHSKLRPDGDGKGGTYFGATGCGKSITMLFLSRMLMRSREFASPTIVLITDRTDLDDQLSKLFGTAKRFIGDECVVEVESREKLREHLAGRTSGGVFLTTIHKFTEDTSLLSERANIICISDEAHRSQTNLSLQVRQTDKGVKRNYGFAKYLHDSLPNATYVGFTGTPIDATIDVFGEVVDAYTMTESVADGITRRIVYEGRAAKVLLDHAKLKEIEEYYKQCAEEGANEYQIEESKKAVTKMERILGDADRLQAVAEDFIAHYENRVAEGSTVEGKAMFVCANRTIAFDLYRKIIALRPKWVQLPEPEPVSEGSDVGEGQERPIEKIKLIMTRNKDDEPALYDLLGTDEDRRAYAEAFKKPKSNFKIALVVDMWTTGFDVDCLDTMYIDKPLQQHTLVQTISRVNRVYPGKEKGLVVDYIGIKNNMNIALRRYAQGDFGLDSVENVEQSITLVKDELDIIRRMFGEFDYSVFTTGTPLEQLDCLNRGAELMQRTKEQENLFMGHAKKLKSAFNLCSNSDQISDAEREEIHYFCGVRSVIYKLTMGESPDASQMNRRVSEMIEEAIQSEGVEEIIQIGNDKDNLDVLSEEYMERLSRLKLPNTKVKLMERLLKTVITEFKKVNKVRGVDFSKRLSALVEKYNSRKDSAVFADEVLTEVANQMADLLKELNKEKRSFLDLGISYEEKAFYDILEAIAKQFGFEYPKDKMLQLAAAIKKIVEDKSKYTDWAARDDIKAELKMDLILVLAEYGYPPVTNDEVYKEILEQAENFKRYNG